MSAPSGGVHESSEGAQSYARKQLSAQLDYIFAHKLQNRHSTKVSRPAKQVSAEELGYALSKLGVDEAVWNKDKAPSLNMVKDLQDVPWVQDMIWEVDENGDGYVAWDNLKATFQRTSEDRTGYEPSKLISLVDFLLMDTEEDGFTTETKIVDFMLLRYGLHDRHPAVLAMLGRHFRLQANPDAADIDPAAYRIYYPEYVCRYAAALRTLREASKK